MTTLLLIRHGQASFGTGDYDRLCERGIAQSHALGLSLRQEGRRIDGAVSGTLNRQSATARHTLEAAGLAPPLVTDPAFDEYPSDGLLAAYLPLAARQDPALAGSVEDLRADRGRFQRALMAVMDLWQAGVDGFAGESWLAFRARVCAGLETAVAGRGPADTVAVFTSGGVIGTAVAAVLKAPDAAALALSWRVFNASVSEIHYGRRGFALSGFNDASHLRRAEDGELLTHR